MDRAKGFLADNCRKGKRGICVTVVVLGIFIGCALLGYTAFASTSHRNATLAQVTIIFRHGYRTPTETYPNDPYLHYKWPDGWGALTKKGMLQMYNLGKWIRDVYGWLIGKSYNSSTSHVQSSYADRCIMSAQALLAGLFPPDPEETFLPGLPWLPVPVHSTPRELDKTIVVKAPCPRLDEALKEAYQNDTKQTDLQSYYAELSNYTGKKISDITDVEFLYNTLEIEDLNKLTLPEWTQKFYNDKMKEIAARSLAIFTSNTLQQRLRGGPLLKEILEHMMETRTKDNWRKLYLYSAHDITLVNVLRTMGFTNELFKPDYGAALIFELHLVNGGQSHEVKVLYLNSTQTMEPHRMSIPGCEDPCLLDNLIKILKPVIPVDWDKECILSN
ncbi:prostatic acid phosphatase isoform X2 [Cephus cinctus]|nr:prostatic acid phosphatase isoform X2 [Cephus cinctus]XP_015588102.1 prostatic acid phosphatase isoform X2 [Cephus cinctus]